MTTTTLAIVNAPTLMGGLVELLRIGDALRLAGHDCGVSVYVDEDGHPLEIEPDYELPAGVLEYVRRVPLEDPWKSSVWRGADPEAREADAARRELLELLANLNPGRDLLATSEDVRYL